VYFVLITAPDVSLKMYFFRSSVKFDQARGGRALAITDEIVYAGDECGKLWLLNRDFLEVTTVIQVI
jgi:hypothetical protein